MEVQSLSEAQLRQESNVHPLNEKSHAVFSKHKNLISQTSDEIKDYEQYLKRNEICLEFKFDTSSVGLEHKQLQCDGDESVRYIIHWGKLEGQKEFRLYYHRVGVGYDVCDGIADEYEISEKRPLVEGPLEVRMFLRTWLNRFNDEFATFLNAFEEEYIEPLPK